MKRIGITLMGAMGATLALAAPALAITAPPGSGGGPGGPAEGGGVATTGANISLGFFILAALIVVGLSMILIGLRRRVGATSKP